MKIFDQKQFLELSKKEGEPFISIYIPVSRQSTDAYQVDRTNLKNQLAKAEKSLQEKYELSKSEIEKILSPAQALLEDYDFWKYNSDMLACFLANGEMDIFKLPVEIAESVCFIGTKPYLMPLIPELNDDGHYYLLLLNLDRISLFEATRNVIQEIELDPEEVATSFTAEEEEDENQDSLQGQGNVGNARAMFHGHGKGSDEEKKETILNYFHRMTNMLEPILYRNPLPLFIAGVEYLGPIFHQASKYNHLMKGQVTGSFTEKDIEELHHKSWEIAEPYFLEERIRRKDQFGTLKAQNLAISNDNQKLIKAALTGVVETLLINKNHQHLWGTYNPETHELNLSENQENGSHCLVDEAAVKVKEYGGKVYIVEPANMPEDNLVAGTLRYEV